MVDCWNINLQETVFKVCFPYLFSKFRLYPFIILACNGTGSRKFKATFVFLSQTITQADNPFKVLQSSTSNNSDFSVINTALFKFISLQ